ncbi:hypothetical protein [Luteipulveratus mongoliensis]|uniref:Uncharacterized protein n=1 Tax=Luteipulveratus mongoliensis TaxID=571913 RepID=A0A0K1JDA3_9MICO|nr:hypothetical protein [Luteipulveratus mongoliensis]AKU14681.1 hypothetical protein VV02_00345 [Luteipulveratus mongoliensis]
MTSRDDGYLWGSFDPQAIPDRPNAHVELPPSGPPRVVGVEIPPRPGESAEGAAIAALARQAQRLPVGAIRATVESASGTRHVVVRADGTLWDLSHAVRPHPSLPLRRLVAVVAVATVVIGGVTVAVIGATASGPDASAYLAVPSSTSTSSEPEWTSSDTADATPSSTASAVSTVPDVVAATGAPAAQRIAAVPSTDPEPQPPQATPRATVPVQPKPPAPSVAPPRQVAPSPRKTVRPKASPTATTVRPRVLPTASMPTIHRGPRIVLH